MDHQAGGGTAFRIALAANPTASTRSHKTMIEGEGLYLGVGLLVDWGVEKWNVMSE